MSRVTKTVTMMRCDNCGKEHQAPDELFAIRHPYGWFVVRGVVENGATNPDNRDFCSHDCLTRYYWMRKTDA